MQNWRRVDQRVAGRNLVHMVHADGELAETNGVKNAAIYRERRVALDCAGLDRDKGSGVFRLEGRKQNADTYG
jgi:hypothetical protein